MHKLKWFSHDFQGISWYKILKKIQTKLIEICSFSWLFDEKIANYRSLQISCENLLTFTEAIVLNLANFQTIDSLASKIDFQSSSENSSSSINDFESLSKLFALFRSFLAILNPNVFVEGRMLPIGVYLDGFYSRRTWYTQRHFSSF